MGGLLYWFFGSSGTAAASIAGDIKLTAEKYWHQKILGESEEDEEASKELASERQKIDEEVEKYIDEGDDSIEDKIVKKREKSRAKNDDGFIGKIARHVNPIAVALGPVQKNLAMTMMPLRMVRYTLFWQDRIFTLWLYIALLVLTLILAILPWGMIPITAAAASASVSSALTCTLSAERLTRTEERRGKRCKSTRKRMTQARTPSWKRTEKS